jgi:hypothetical protein
MLRGKKRSMLRIGEMLRKYNRWRDLINAASPLDAKKFLQINVNA